MNICPIKQSKSASILVVRSIYQKLIQFNINGRNLPYAVCAFVESTKFLLYLYQTKINYG